ncbi:CPBP family intramembrane glutamic endopeptidase [Thomasclavelia sp.]
MNTNIILTILLLFYFIIIFISVLRKKEIFFKTAFYIGLVIIIITVYNNLLLISGKVTIFLSIFIGLISYLIAVASLNFKISNQTINCIFNFNNYIYCKKKIFKTIITSVYEEILWRGSIFYIFNSNMQIVILSFLFSILHIGKKITVIECIELFIFSLIEYIILVYSQNILNCIIVHIAKNIFIILLDRSINKEKIKGNEYVR